MSHLPHYSRMKKRQPGGHLKYTDRQLIERKYMFNQSRAKKKRISQAKMAEELGISPATLSRELKRGKVKLRHSSLEYYFSYSADVAQADYDEKGKRKGPKVKLDNNLKLIKRMEDLLLGESEKNGRAYSPYAVVNILLGEGWAPEDLVSSRTVYNYVDKGIFLNVTQEDLPRKGKPKKRPYKHIKRSQKVPEGKQIEERPVEAEERLEAGHWEMDCIESGRPDKTCLLTLVDRFNREAIIMKITSQTQRAVDRALNGIERAIGAEIFRERFKSFTVDNGPEFWDWKQLETSVLSTKKRTSIYYAHPYSSWERGSNENLNGFIRYFIPKSSKISTYTRKEIKELQDFINNYPRLILGGQSALEFANNAA